ncbi:hypothetical protein FGO68_gene13862 [Halteria grandinella]|uniref:Uncharacterized protein n=1 Tax=Halteria grandinella TaxID=5974 RepID=A0A8J8NM81_HALGN|nr:hypothetical protein FGO68_gene13862 [Halteria grandinella]
MTPILSSFTSNIIPWLMALKRPFSRGWMKGLSQEGTGRGNTRSLFEILTNNLNNHDNSANMRLKCMYLTLCSRKHLIL